MGHTRDFEKVVGRSFAHFFCPILFVDEETELCKAHKALQRLAARVRSDRDALERHLRFEPTKTSKSRIKRLRGLMQPQYRLRVNDIRVFYDVTETSVEILAIIEKQEAQAWLDQEGTPGESGGSGQG